VDQRIAIMAEPSSSVDPSSPLSFSQFLERKEEAQGGPLSSHQIDLLDSFIAKVKGAVARLLGERRL